MTTYRRKITKEDLLDFLSPSDREYIDHADESPIDDEHDNIKSAALDR